MQLIVPPEMRRRLIEALVRAKDQEIGGILMGEHVSENTFRVCDLTIQYHSGSFARFVRSACDFLVPLSRFFQKTNYHYTQFNYLGEWHSHPSFTTVPSTTDRATMRNMAMDQRVGANFVVLLIVRLNEPQDLEGSVNIFQKSGNEFLGELIFEQHDNA